MFLSKFKGIGESMLAILFVLDREGMFPYKFKGIDVSKLATLAL